MRLLRKKKDNLEARIERLARYGASQEMMDKLARYLREADDRELYKVNPHHVAARLGVDVHTALGILACAVQEGLFDLNWDVHCPHCKGQARTFSTLRDGRSEEFCTNCQVGFAPHLDHEVHVTFSVNESVRDLSATEPLPDAPYLPTLGLELLHVQPFRDLFADHVLPPGESLQVKRVAFLFTDLQGSTAMYVREGDPRAYGWVREHFEVLFQAANRNRGITVKTIGDAVMASFMTSLDALRTTIDVYRGIGTLNQQLGLSGDKALAIRQGVHVGPCISVTLNERLDYFGATVNIASRVSHLSYGRDVVLTQVVLASQETQAEALQRGRLEGFESELHGYEQSFQLQRLFFGD
jgi:class 3 adenylate cyclase